MGQIIYYAFPPVIFEAQKIIRKEDMTVERFLHELKSAQKRVTKYVTSKLGKIFSNTAKYSLQGTTQGRYLTGGVPPVRFSM